MADTEAAPTEVPHEEPAAAEAPPSETADVPSAEDAPAAEVAAEATEAPEADATPEAGLPDPAAGGAAAAAAVAARLMEQHAHGSFQVSTRARSTPRRRAGQRRQAPAGTPHVRRLMACPPSPSPPLQGYEGAEGNNKRPREDPSDGGPEGPDKKRASTGMLGGENGGGDQPYAAEDQYTIGDPYATGGAAAAAQQGHGDPYQQSHAHAGGNPGGNPGPGYGDMPGGASAVLDFPAAMVGRLIGKAGETIRNLQDGTGTRIQIDHDTPGEFRRVTISGTSQ